MEIEVAWADDQQRLIYVKYLGTWTWDEYDDSIRRVSDLMRAVEHPVDVIIDTRAHPQPPDSNVLTHFRKAREDQPANFGQVVIVGGASFMRLISNAAIRVFGWRGGAPRFVDTPEQAQAIINDYRASIEKQ
jgi:hypothetical protein